MGVVGICILNWNSGDSLVTCVRALQPTAAAPPAQILVVDNCSGDSSLEFLRSTFPETPIIKNQSNLGYARGNNIGAEHLLALGCDVLVFLNPDAVLTHSALAALLQTLERSPETGCVGGVPVASSGESLRAARHRPSALQKIVCAGPLCRVPGFGPVCKRHWILADQLEEDAVVHAIMGACCAFRSEAFRDIRGFDESTFLYEEELIAAERLHAAGWTIRLSKGAHYQHTEGVSTRRIPYRKKLHLYASEHHLLSTYYRWNPIACGALRLYRYIEWLACIPLWALTRTILPRLLTPPHGRAR